MKQFVAPIALLVLCGCAPVPPQFPTCDVETYLQTRVPPAVRMIECGTLDNFSPASVATGFVFWQCIREAVGSAQEFHAQVKGFTTRDSGSSPNATLEIYSLRWSGSSGAFLRWTNVGTVYPWGAPGATIWLSGSRNGPNVVMGSPRLEIAPISRSFILTSSTIESPFPPPEMTSFVDHLQVAQGMPDVRNELWCRGF